MPSKKAANIDRPWLVKYRSQIQDRMLQLDALNAAIEKEGADHLRPFFNMMVGVAFSLWRAVFLIRISHDEKLEYEHASELLGILIETNAVNFTDDRKTSNWMAGYYINNAALRLYAMTSLRQTARLLDLPTKKWIRENLRPNEVNSGAWHHQEVWEKLLNGFDRATKDLQKRLQAVPR